MQQYKSRLIMDGTAEFDASALYQRYAPSIFRYLRLHTPTREDAEDILVDVFLAAVEHDYFASLPDRDQQLWLWRVAHNKVADFHRRAARRPQVTLEAVADSCYFDDELAPEQMTLREEEYEELRATVGRLSAQQQEVLRLRFVDGLRCTEIATRMGKREGTVRMLLSRTLNALRTIYENL